MGRRDMIHKELCVGRWIIAFYFAPDGYDIDTVLDVLYDSGAGARVMRQALTLIESGKPNTGFTFTNPFEHIAVVLVGPTSSGEEFQNTFSHEIRHLVNDIVTSLGIELDTEPSSYLTGDMVMELADVVCQLGCRKCN